MTEDLPKTFVQQTKQQARNRDEVTTPQDWEAFHISSQEHWEDYYDTQLTYAENFCELYKRCVLLQEEEVLSKIVTVYAVANSKAHKWIPVLFFQGESGSGKSISSYLIAAFRGEAGNIIGSGATFASIRNLLNQLRWHELDPESPDYSFANERPYIMVWADIKEQNLEMYEGKIFGLLRNGVDRSEEKLMIAAPNGENTYFHVFGAKVISSTQDFYTRSKWAELARRLIVIKCQKIDQFPIHIQEEFNARDLIDPYSINWKGIHMEFTRFWTPTRLETLARLYKKKSSIKRSWLKQDGMTEHRFKCSFELYCATVASEICGTEAEAKQLWLKYWEWNERVIGLGHHLIHQLLEDMIKEKAATTIAFNQQLVARGQPELQEPLEIDPKDVARVINDAFNSNLIPSFRDPRLGHEAMTDLGFTLQRNRKNRHVWMKE